LTFQTVIYISNRWCFPSFNSSVWW